MRIQPSATTATLAAQSSAQSALPGDSFAVILGAASEEPVSIQPVAGSAAKEHSGQSPANRGADKQTEMQKPAVQRNRSFHATTARPSSARIESDIDGASGELSKFNEPVDGSLSFTTGRNWSAGLNTTIFPASAAPTIASGATSTSPIAARTTWSASTFRASIAGSSQQAACGASPAKPDTQAQAGGRIANRQVDQPSPQLPAAGEGASSIVAGNFAQPIQVNATDAEKSPIRSVDPTLIDAAPAASEKTANAAPAAASHNQLQTAAAQSARIAPPTVGRQAATDAQASDNPLEATADADSSASAAQNGPSSAAAGSIGSIAQSILPQTISLPIPEVLLPQSSVALGQGNGMDFANNTTLKADPSAAKLTNPDSPGASNSGASKSKDEMSGSGDASTHVSQNAQTDPSQNVGQTSKPQDIAALHPPVQTGASVAGAHESTMAPPMANAPASASHSGTVREAAPAADLEGVDSMPASGVSVAKLVQAMSESEMRIGLSSNGFGDISIRTSVSNHQMLAQISLDHSELSQAISSHVSSVQAKLSDDYGLRASIEVDNLPSTHSGEPGTSSQRERGNSAAALPSEGAAAQGEDRIGLGQEAMASAGSETRLDIRA